MKKTKNIIEAKKLSKKFVTHTKDKKANKQIVWAVKNVSFHVKEGEIYGILGPNGSGKSTLIRMLSTLLLPDSGLASIGGFDIVRKSLEVKRLIGRVSVEASFFKKMSALENLAYMSQLYGLKWSDTKPKAIDILAGLHVKEGRLKEPLEDFSRGMQQKIAIARALMCEPSVLMLDEPTTGLDPLSKRHVQKFMLDLNERHNTTIILTTHDMPEADKVCDRIAIIFNGEFVVEGTPEQLKKKAARAMKRPSVSLEDAYIYYTGSKWEKNDAFDAE